MFNGGQQSNCCLFPKRTGLRGHELKMFQQRAKRNLRKNTFSLRVASTWNGLPKEVVEAPSVDCFKNRLDKFWRNKEMLYRGVYM